MTWHDGLMEHLTPEERVRRVGPYAIGDNAEVIATGEVGTITDIHSEDVMLSVGAVADRLGIDEPARPDQRIQVLTLGNITRLVSEDEIRTPAVEWHEAGKWTSLPMDQRAFLEREREDTGWIAYRTDPEEGRLLDGFPKLREEPFPTLAEAQAWVAAHVPPRGV